MQRDAIVRRIEFRYLDLPPELPRARRMSFFLTRRQVLAREKDVTRRAAATWSTLKPGDKLVAIEKGQGLCDITAEDCAREGFPEYSPSEFVEFYLRESKGGRRQRGGADACA